VARVFKIGFEFKKRAKFVKPLTESHTKRSFALETRRHSVRMTTNAIYVTN